VDLLLRQRGGRAYAVAQLDELDGSPAALPLQLEVSLLLRGMVVAVLSSGCNLTMARAVITDH
jgi:hypothetical protein